MIVASAQDLVHLSSDEDSVQSSSDGNQCPKSGSTEPQASAEQMSGNGSEARRPESVQRPGRCPPDVEVLRQVVANKGVYYPKYVFIQTKRGSNMYRLHRSFTSVSPSTDQVIKSAPENLIPDGMVRETRLISSPYPETIAVYPSGLTEEPTEDNPSTLVFINPTVVKSNEQPPVAASSRCYSSSNESEGEGEVSAGEEADEQMSEKSASPESPTRGDPESGDQMEVNRQEAAASQYRKMLPESLPESGQIRTLSPIVINLNTEHSKSFLSKYAAPSHPDPVPAPSAAPIPDSITVPSPPPPRPSLPAAPPQPKQLRQLNVNVNPSSSQTMVSSPYGLIIVPKTNFTPTKSLLPTVQMRLRSTSTTVATPTTVAPPKAAPIARTAITITTLKDSGMTIKRVTPIITSPVNKIITSPVKTVKRPITVPPKQVFQNSDQLTAEMQMIRSKEYHEKIVRQKERERQRQDDLVTCRDCGLKFSQTHEMIHRPKPYECIECSRKFRSKHNMESHVKDKHKNCSPRFKCLFCEKAYLTDSQLRVHTKKHTTPKIVCEYCGKMFNFQRALNVHIFHAHKPDELPAELLKDKCPHCDHIPESKCALVNHMRIHTGEKPFACKICHKTYRQSGALSQHMLVHTKERPYKCKECDSCFRSWNNLRVHKDRVHIKKPRFQCKDCERVFYSPSDRMKHHRRHHIGVKNHACEFCPKAFFEKQELKRHLRRFHGLEVSGERAEKGAEPEVILEEGSSGSQTDCQSDSTSNSHPVPVPSKTLPQLISEILNE